MKKTFIFYNDWIDYTLEMNLEEKGLFLQTILLYQQGLDVGDIGSIKYIRPRVKKQLEEDNKKRDEEIEKRREAGRLGGLSTQSKFKQNQALAGSAKANQADNVNVYVNVNKNDNNIDNIEDIDNKNILSKDRIEQSSDFSSPDPLDIKKDLAITNPPPTPSRPKTPRDDIVEVIEKIKNKCKDLGVAYNKKNDSNFIKHILTAKEYGEFCSSKGYDRVDFALRVLDASIQIGYWKGPCSGPMMIYQNYTDVYNQTLLKSAEKQKKMNNVVSEF